MWMPHVVPKMGGGKPKEEKGQAGEKNYNKKAPPKKNQTNPTTTEHNQMIDSPFSLLFMFKDT